MEEENTITTSIGGHGTCTSSLPTGNDGNISEKGIYAEEKMCSHAEFQTKYATVCHSKRWILALLGSSAALIGGIYRADISIAVVCMVHTFPANDTQKLVLSNESVNYSYFHIETEEATEAKCQREGSDTFHSKGAEFTWSKGVQSLILAGYFYGYIFLQIPGGWLADKYGGKHLISVGMVLNALFTLLTPLLARWNEYSVIVSRVFVGISGGLVTPAWFALTSNWALKHERSRFIAMYMAGQQVGYIVGYASSGLLCAHGFDNGWGSIFYVHGLAGMAFVLLWLYLVSSSPEKHSSISEAELEVLSKHLGHNKRSIEVPPLTVPWKKIASSMAVWSIFIVHTCDNWIYYLISICLPVFLEEVLKIDIQSNGFYSALPFITNTVGLLVASFVADFIISKTWFSRTTTRKLFQISGQVLGASFLIGSSYVTCDKRHLVIFLIGLCMFVEAFGIASGYSGNFVDMAPRYAGLLYAISNTLATIPGMFAPLAVARLTRNGTSSEWQVVFYMAAGFALCGCLVYGIFSRSEPVSWANPTVVEFNVEIPLSPECDKKENDKIPVRDIQISSSIVPNDTLDNSDFTGER